MSRNPDLTLFIHTLLFTPVLGLLDNVNRKVYNMQYNMGIDKSISSWFAYSAAYATGREHGRKSFLAVDMRKANLSTISQWFSGKMFT